MIRADKDSGNIIWDYKAVDWAHDGDPDWAAGAAVMSTSCGELIASVQKDGWSYAVRAASVGTVRKPFWQFPPTIEKIGEDKFLLMNHGNDDYRRPGAAWNDVFIVRTGGEARDFPTDNVGEGADQLHALNACAAAEEDRVRWIADIPNIPCNNCFDQFHVSYSAPTVTGGVVFIGTNADPNDPRKSGHLVVLGDPSVVPPAGVRCSNSHFSSEMCPPKYVLVPRPTVLADVPMPDGGSLAAMRNEPVLAKGRVFVATEAGHVYMLEPP
jgi:hypothetical protein